MKKEFHIPITSEGKTAVDYLAESSELSKQKLKQCMQKGCVWLEREGSKVSSNELSEDVEAIIQKGYIQRLRRAKKVLKKNQTLHFYYDESVLSIEASPAILVEDCGDYSIWNKPSGMLSQGSKWGDHCTIYRWVEKNLQPERAAFVVHRLDRAATGLILLAHKKSVASQFSRLFEKREIYKRYLVKVKGDFSKNLTDKNDVFTINDLIDEKTAVSHVSFSSYDSTQNTSVIEVDIETGRKHQIRKHLSNIGFPVLGDRLYGSNQSSDDAINLDLQLQARKLQFICPITSEKKVFTL